MPDWAHRNRNLPLPKSVQLARFDTEERCAWMKGTFFYWGQKSLLSTGGNSNNSIGSYSGVRVSEEGGMRMEGRTLDSRLKGTGLRAGTSWLPRKLPGDFQGFLGFIPSQFLRAKIMHREEALPCILMEVFLLVVWCWVLLFCFGFFWSGIFHL